MNRHLPTFLLLAFLVTALSSTACVYESEHLKDLKCSPNGKRQGDALCIDGLWIYDPVDASATSDADNIPGEDGGADVVEPPLDSGDGLQDIGSDASDDVSDDASNADSGNPDTGQPDVGNPDTGDSDVDEPDAGKDIGQSCAADDDCISGYCQEGLCAVNLCTNGVLDAGEADIDCGGTCAQQCGDYRDVAAGGRHTCAIRADHSVMCWGAAPQMENSPDATKKFAQITAGNEFSCGIYLNAQDAGNIVQSNVYCWGKDIRGSTTPPANIVFKSINAGREHVCGITSDDTLHCWGNSDDNRANPAGNPTGHDSEVWTQVSAGTRHSCATTITNKYKCWGEHTKGQREFNDRDFNKSYKHMVASELHTCVIKPDDKIECVAKGTPDIKKNIPSFTVSHLDSRSDYACAINQDNASLACWGNNSKNRVSQAPSSGEFSKISTGWEHACTLSKAGGVITCWGNTADARFPAAFAVQ